VERELGLPIRAATEAPNGIDNGRQLDGLSNFRAFRPSCELPTERSRGPLPRAPLFIPVLSQVTQLLIRITLFRTC